MSANHRTTTAILDDLTRAVATVESEQQRLDGAIESRNKIIMDALWEGVPAKDIAERMGVLIADVELLMSSHLPLMARPYEQSQNGRA